MASRNSPQKSPWTPSYQRPTAAQKYRETPPNKENGPGSIPSPSPKRESSRHCAVTARTPSSAKPNGPLKTLHNTSTLPVRSRKPIRPSQASVQTLHISGNRRQLVSPRKPAADYSAEDTPLTPSAMHELFEASTPQHNDTPLPNTNASPQPPDHKERRMHELATEARRCHKRSDGTYDIDSAIAGLARFHNINSAKIRIPLQSEDCVPDCIQGSLGGWSKAEYYFVHDGLDLLSKLERKIIEMQRIQGVQYTADEAQKLCQQLARKYNELIDVAPLRSIPQTTDQAQAISQDMQASLEHIIKQQSDHVIAEIESAIRNREDAQTARTRELEQEVQRLEANETELIREKMCQFDQISNLKHRLSRTEVRGEKRLREHLQTCRRSRARERAEHTHLHHLYTLRKIGSDMLSAQMKAQQEQLAEYAKKVAKLEKSCIRVVSPPTAEVSLRDGSGQSEESAETDAALALLAKDLDGKIRVKEVLEMFGSEESTVLKGDADDESESETETETEGEDDSGEDDHETPAWCSAIAWSRRMQEAPRV